MKFFAKIMVNSPELLQRVPIKQDLGIEIHHKGNVYTIAIDNNDNLILRSITDMQLIILPKSCNSIEIKSEL
jgi:hypothetical protein